MPGTRDSKLPLAGIRVVEMGRMLAAPLVGQLLGDLGAEVVKIERPHEGDDFRRAEMVDNAGIADLTEDDLVANVFIK